MTTKPEPVLWLTDARGIYLPRDFATSLNLVRDRIKGVTNLDWKTLEAGPDNDRYWETWDDVANNALVTDDKGVEHRLHLDGDLWLVPTGMEWDEETDWFVWPTEEDA